MKRTIIGIWLTALGVFIIIPILIQVGDYSSVLGSWITPPGKFLTAVDTLAMGIPFGFATFILLLGLIVLVIEYFRKS